MSHLEMAAHIRQLPDGLPVSCYQTPSGLIKVECAKELVLASQTRLHDPQNPVTIAWKQSRSTTENDLYHI